MHAQTQSNPVRWHGLDRRAEPISKEKEALRLLSEQAAIPLDQLARLLGVEPAQAARVARRLEAEGLVGVAAFLVRDRRWFWPSRRGIERAGTGYRYTVPDVSMLRHRRAVNEVRLHLLDRAPQGDWVSERAVLSRRERFDHLPDAVFEVGGERHAIEVELSRKGRRRIHEILAAHSGRYDAVIYFCGRGTYGFMKRVQAEGRWPKLLVHRLPGAEPC